MNIECRKVATLSEFVDAIRLRVDAFIIEQGGKPGWEPDVEDRSAEHFIALKDGEVVAVLRVRRDLTATFKIERMVTAKSVRGCGVGRELLQFVVAELRAREEGRIWMQAQVQARSFYEKCGFREISDEYDLYGILHLDMEYLG